MKKILLYVVLASALLLAAGCGEDEPPYVAVWSIYQAPEIGGVSLNGVDGTTRDVAWAVGDDGLMMSYYGTDWSDYASSPTSWNLYGIDIGYDGTGWAVGAAGTVLSMSGGIWTVEPPVTGADLYGVAKDALGGAWAVGDSGTVLRYDGANWAAVNHSLTTADLRGVSISPDGLVVIVGDKGVILEFQSDTWSSPASPVTDKLSSVSATDAGVFVCGAVDIILKRTDTGWGRVSTSGNLILNDIEVSSASVTKGFAGGVNGALYELQNGTWLPAELPKVDNIGVDVNGITLSDDMNGWAVGNNGLILRYGIIY